MHRVFRRGVINCVALILWYLYRNLFKVDSQLYVCQRSLQSYREVNLDIQVARNVEYERPLFSLSRAIVLDYRHQKVRHPMFDNQIKLTFHGFAFMTVYNYYLYHNVLHS
jgi:hypothetical protein